MYLSYQKTSIALSFRVCIHSFCATNECKHQFHRKIFELQRKVIKKFTHLNTSQKCAHIHINGKLVSRESRQASPAHCAQNSLSHQWAQQAQLALKLHLNWNVSVLTLLLFGGKLVIIINVDITASMWLSAASA